MMEPNASLILNEMRMSRLVTQRKAAYSRALIAVEGRAELIRDRATFQQHWRPDLDKWFKKGVDTPGLVLLKVRATRIKLCERHEEQELVL